MSFAEIVNRIVSDMCRDHAVGCNNLHDAVRIDAVCDAYSLAMLPRYAEHCGIVSFKRALWGAMLDGQVHLVSEDLIPDGHREQFERAACRPLRNPGDCAYHWIALQPNAWVADYAARKDAFRDAQPEYLPVY